MSLPKKIISGGQTGADRAGLDFALARGIEHGGWCPRGRRSNDDAPIPAHYQLIETPSDGYKDRTLRNVAAADATVIFNLRPGKSLSTGSALTLQACVAQRKPYLLLRPAYGPDASRHAAETVASFLREYRPATLNVAGNREESVPGIGAFVRNVLAQTWELVPLMAAAVAMQVVQPPREKQMGMKF